MSDHKGPTGCRIPHCQQCNADIQKLAMATMPPSKNGKKLYSTNPVLYSSSKVSDNTLDNALDVLYMQGEQAGVVGYNSATHQIVSVNGAKKELLKWHDTAVAEAKLEILMGFRRRDFVDEYMYKVAVLDRITAIQAEMEKLGNKK